MQGLDTPTASRVLSLLLLNQQSIQQLNHASSNEEVLRLKMNEPASALPEYAAVMSTFTLHHTAPDDDKVYQFLTKKRSEGKPYYVCMTVGANKFPGKYKIFIYFCG